MALQTYTPNANQIVHTTGVDLNARPSIFKPIHIVQYDVSIPIIAVELYNNGNEYAAPSSANANIRFRKKGGTVVYNPALGCSTDRKILYFEVTRQMVADYGDFKPIVELKIGETVAGSSAITVVVDKNPIQDGDIESSDEYKTFTDYINDAKKYSDSANASKNAAATSEANAKASEDAAKKAEQSVDSKVAALDDMREDVEVLNEMRKDLLKTQDIRDPLLDSSGGEILDSSSKNIYGRVVFPNESDLITLRNNFDSLEKVYIEEMNRMFIFVSELQKKITSMQSLLDELEPNVSDLQSSVSTLEDTSATLQQDLSNLSDHALLDNSYQK